MIIRKELWKVKELIEVVFCGSFLFDLS